MLTVKISAEARSEIVRQTKFITNRGNPENARRWKARITKQIQSLSHYSERFPVVDFLLQSGEIRKCVFESHNIYYKVDSDSKTIYVVTILPAAQDKSANS